MSCRCGQPVSTALIGGDRWTWLACSEQMTAALEREMRRWLGTPYMDGQRAAGPCGGVDCRNLAAGLLDRLSRSRRSSPLPPLSRDAGVHSPRAGAHTVRARMDAHDGHRVRDATIAPGDIVVVSQEQGGRRIGHAMIAATRPWVALHAIPGPGVVWGAIGGLSRVLAIYRPTEKHQWH